MASNVVTDITRPLTHTQVRSGAVERVEGEGVKEVEKVEEVEEI